ncbi:hypothetical protein B0O99DRAFT_684403 [Bisporella sp. PMI_857]|nr:hypothetical protein B0O99DRAFT_684403 [Bisporella sp. PMI_857]
MSRMSSPMQVADLHNQDGLPSSISFQSINFSEHDDLLHNIFGFHTISEALLRCSIYDQHCNLDEIHKKAYLKGKKAATKVVHLLNRKVQTDSLYRDVIEKVRPDTSYLRVTERALVGGPPCDGRAKDLEGISSYQDIDFQFSVPSILGRKAQFKSTQHLHFSCPSLKIEDTLFLENDKSTFEQVDILSGHLPSFQKWEVFRIDEGSNAFLPCGSAWMFQASTIFIQWMNNSNGDCVFEKAISYELDQRGIAGLYNSFYRIQVSPRDNLVSSSIREALLNGRRPSLGHVLQNLLDQGDRVWQDFYNLLLPKELPQNFRELGYLFYVFQIIRPALLGNLGGHPRPRRLLISVDDGAERRIYSRAQKLLKKIRQTPFSFSDPTLIEIYMSRSVFINKNQTGSNLYLHDPTPELPVMSVARPGLGDNVSTCLPSETKMEWVDIIRELLTRSVSLRFYLVAYIVRLMKYV